MLNNLPKLAIYQIIKYQICLPSLFQLKSARCVELQQTVCNMLLLFHHQTNHFHFQLSPVDSVRKYKGFQARPHTRSGRSYLPRTPKLKVSLALTNNNNGTSENNIQILRKSIKKLLSFLGNFQPKFNP